MTYKVGDIVLARPNWPTKPAFGIWTRDTVLVTEGRPARISTVWPWDTGDKYQVQFDRDGDGSFHDAHWPLKESEIVRLLEATS